MCFSYFHPWSFRRTVEASDKNDLTKTDHSPSTLLAERIVLPYIDDMQPDDSPVTRAAAAAPFSFADSSSKTLTFLRDGVPE